MMGGQGVIAGKEGWSYRQAKPGKIKSSSRGRVVNQAAHQRKWVRTQTDTGT